MKKTQSKNWELDRLFPNGLDGVHKQKQEEIEQLSSRLKAAGKTETLEEFLFITESVQKLYSDVYEIEEYAICVSSEDVQDPEGQRVMDQSQRLKADLDAVMLAYKQYLAGIDKASWKVWIDAEELTGIRNFLLELRKKAEDLSLPEVEHAIQTLSKNGFDGWEDLFEYEFTQLRVPVDLDGKSHEWTFDHAFMKAMLTPDRNVRTSIAASLMDVCRKNKDRFALILNHFAGFRNDRYALKGWKNPLEEMYTQNRISEASVSQMMDVLHDRKRLLYRFLERKAEIDQLPKLNWYDLYAPSFTSKTSLTYEQATEIITKQFSEYSRRLGDFAQQAFNKGWVDAEPHESKRPGGFCASLPNAKESRVLFSFQGSYQDVVTLAHELGHAYHNTHLHEQPGFAQHAGTGLAETASTFAENLVLDAAIDHAERKEDALSLLEMKIINGLKYTTFIPSKFEFEKEFYVERINGKLSSTKITEMMEAKEREWFGDHLEQVNGYHWMTIPHFYDTEKAFYNLPYTIGYLFSNGIYAQYKANPEGFPEKYDELLRHSGDMPMDRLCADFLGQDLTRETFWKDAFRPLEEAIEEYLALTEKYTMV